MRATLAGPFPAQPTTFGARFSWALFDWANQPFFTLITTFIFAPYFAQVVIGDAVKGQALWGYGQAAAGLLIALFAPLLGAIADAGGRRKPWILVFQVLTVAGCVALWWAAPGRPDLAWAILAAVIVATVGAEFSIVFNNALLPSLARPENLGKLSGLGWSMGYLGGLIALFATLAVSKPDLFGLPPPAGIDGGGYFVERLVGPASALWLIVFVAPMFRFTPDGKASGLSGLRAAREGWANLSGALRGLRHYRNPALFLLAFMIYNNGLAAVIGFGGIYAAGTFGWGTTELGAFGIVVTVFATAGALAGGWLDDRLGSRPTALAAVAAVTLASLGIMSIDATHVLFVVAVDGRPNAAMFASAPQQVFLVFAIILGVGMGPMQAASRTLVARLAPAEMVGAFYGLFALSARATGFVAPLLVAVATQAFASQRAGLAVVLGFLVLGFVLLIPVREVRASVLR
jgi:MFS transporter, UMF1 family